MINVCELQNKNMFFLGWSGKKSKILQLTLILAQASCVDSIPRKSLIINDPKYWGEK